MKNDFLILAHRGFSGAYPENTLLAFDEALKCGAKAMELDVQLDAENEAVIYHDFFLGRTTPEEDPEKRIRELTTEAFLELDVGGYKNGEFYDTPPPLLSEVLGRYSQKMFLNLELKVFDPSDSKEVEALATRTAELIREYEWSNGIISSFTPEVLKQLKKINPSLSLALLGPRISDHNLLNDAILLGATAYNFDGRSGVAKTDVENIHKAGLKTYAYTINDTSRALELYNMGVDGIFTDHPDQMLKFFEVL